MIYPCELQEKLTQNTLSIRTRSAIGDLSAVMGKTFGAITQYLAEAGEKPAGPPFTVYYNMDMQDLDLEIGFPVSKRLDSRGEIQSGEIPDGQFAACLYTGPYSAIEPAYTALSEWLRSQGLTATGVADEFYLNDPATTPADELQTQILFPLERT